tara:strand:- start:1150 stop:1695 length:546 start_codon:yes stop_codon:yes gene_type:complete
MKSTLTKRVVKTTAWAISVLFLFLNSGCGLLNVGSFQTENGYYIRHYNSCAPKAIRDAMEELENKIISTKSISTEIQDGGNFCRVFFAATIHHNVLWVTFPSELKKYFTERGYGVIKTNLKSLGPDDVAIILVKGRIMHGEWHWITYPTYSKEAIENFYEQKERGSTSVITTYLIKKRAAN